jgi:hypothetical protein
MSGEGEEGQSAYIWKYERVALLDGEIKLHYRIWVVKTPKNIQIVEPKPAHIIVSIHSSIPD